MSAEAPAVSGGCSPPRNGVRLSHRVSLTAGRNFGVSVTVNALSDDFVLDLTVTNSYVRHLSASSSAFLEGDGRTAIVRGRQHLDAADEGSDAADRPGVVRTCFDDRGRRGAAQDLHRERTTTRSSSAGHGRRPRAPSWGSRSPTTVEELHLRAARAMFRSARCGSMVGSLGTSSSGSHWDPDRSLAGPRR